jgi:hypothetical protein
MTASNYLESSPLRIITYVFSFVERLLFCQYQRALALARSVLNNCLDIPLHNNEKLSFTSNFVKKHFGSVSSKSETSQLPISQDECEETPIFTENSKCEAYEVKKVGDSEVTEESENHVSFKINDIEQGSSKKEKQTSMNEKPRRVSDAKTREYMAGTQVGLDGYNRVNSEYFYKKYYSGMEVDDYSFVHSSANLVYSKSLFIQGAYLKKSSKVRASKRKAPMFKPTELSTIFENLAY